LPVSAKEREVEPTGTRFLLHVVPVGEGAPLIKSENSLWDLLIGCSMRSFSFPARHYQPRGGKGLLPVGG